MKRKSRKMIRKIIKSSSGYKAAKNYVLRSVTSGLPAAFAAVIAAGFMGYFGISRKK